MAHASHSKVEERPCDRTTRGCTRALVALVPTRLAVLETGVLEVDLGVGGTQVPWWVLAALDGHGPDVQLSQAQSVGGDQEGGGV